MVRGELEEARKKLEQYEGNEKKSGGAGSAQKSSESLSQELKLGQ